MTQQKIFVCAIVQLQSENVYAQQRKAGHADSEDDHVPECASTWLQQKIRHNLVINPSH